MIDIIEDKMDDKQEVPPIVPPDELGIPKYEVQEEFRNAGTMEVLPKLSFCVHRKPAWFHRVMMRLLLGWRWTDEEES